MSHSGHANLSARIGDSLVITSTGSVQGLTPESLSVVDLDGVVREGSMDPTNREIVTMHTRVYRSRPEVGGVIHTHSPHLLAFALANKPLPDRYEALLRFGQADEVPVVAWAPRGSDRSVDGIIEAIEERRATSAVLLGNHGVLVFGESVAAAASLLLAMEEAAAAELRSIALGGAVDFPAGALEQARESMARARA